MSIDDFNTFYIFPLLNKFFKENKTIFLLGVFNIDLIKSDLHSTQEFLILLSSNYFLLIVHPTRIVNKSKTTFDNIFSNLK